ncbi:hypothetical protein EYF80_002144 [Liparis tanakae]|uniref:Uncharacterized protein n=1 Tax=Liparis tanakae TaxID=230148 RepID=A0A4Z2JBP6_9TELE|nr:hypothetical protein EYF80_002144 [Liparis tanakae]
MSVGRSPLARLDILTLCVQLLLQLFDGGLLGAQSLSQSQQLLLQHRINRRKLDPCRRLGAAPDAAAVTRRSGSRRPLSREARHQTQKLKRPGGRGASGRSEWPVNDGRSRDIPLVTEGKRREERDGLTERSARVPTERRSDHPEGFGSPAAGPQRRTQQETGKRR